MLQGTHATPGNMLWYETAVMMMMNPRHSQRLVSTPPPHPTPPHAQLIVSRCGTATPNVVKKTAWMVKVVVLNAPHMQTSVQC